MTTKRNALITACLLAGAISAGSVWAHGKVTPTAVERPMRDEDFIVSKTDLKGRITYCNRIFIEFSGYAESELLGAPHNCIRHPDMPRGGFK